MKKYILITLAFAGMSALSGVSANPVPFVDDPVDHFAIAAASFDSKTETVIINQIADVMYLHVAEEFTSHSNVIVIKDMLHSNPFVWELNTQNWTVKRKIGEVINKPHLSFSKKYLSCMKFC